MEEPRTRTHRQNNLVYTFLCYGSQKRQNAYTTLLVDLIFDFSLVILQNICFHFARLNEFHFHILQFVRLQQYEACKTVAAFCVFCCRCFKRDRMRMFLIYQTKTKQNKCTICTTKDFLSLILSMHLIVQKVVFSHRTNVIQLF